MTAAQFNKFWISAYPAMVPIQDYFRHAYPEKWCRIHSLPESKRYPDNKNEWNTLLDRQNKIISDLLNDNPEFLLVTGNYITKDGAEIFPIDEAISIKTLSFVSLDPIDLNKLEPKEFEQGEFYLPMFSVQTWLAGKFDDLLKDMAQDNLRAFFVSPEKALLIMPYAGGIDFILMDTKSRDFYRNKYRDWLSGREDGT